jgi:membrane-associated phospholipid phosphatase
VTQSIAARALRFSLHIALTSALLGGVATPLAAQDGAVADDNASQPAGVGAGSSSSSHQIVQLPPLGPAPTPRHTGIMAMTRGLWTDVTNLPSRQNLFWVGVGAAGALATHPADTSVTSELVDASWAHTTFGAGAVLGQSYTLLAAAGTVYAVGRAKDLPRVSHMGMDLLRSIAIAEFMTQTVKFSVNRTRPDGTARSFPSGHAADTFAFATALERHFNWKYSVPGYAFASYVAASRLHDNRHYLSDVMAGAAVGIIAGRTVTRHGRENFPVALTPVPGGAAVMFVRDTAAR